MIEKVRLTEKFAQFPDTWSPKIVGEVNDAHVKLVKLKGEFVWHHHESEYQANQVMLQGGKNV
jgi:hypothetical protein